jgi:branched-chain amino acid transport system ATP-binding protein
MLELDGVRAGYGRVQVLWEVSLRVGEGEIVALIGPNGAGKTTTLRAISGLLPVIGGQIRFAGRRIAGTRPHRIVGLGLSQVPEGRRLFAGLTVRENLELGGYLARRSGGAPARLAEVFQLFPRLAERQQQHAGSLSGGEQQMLAIGRGLMSGPRCLLLDEPSLGLAPLIVKEIGRIVAAIRERGTTVLLVEQNAILALRLADRGYVMENGRVVLEDTGARLRENPAVRTSYLGGAAP